MVSVVHAWVKSPPNDCLDNMELADSNNYTCKDCFVSKEAPGKQPMVQCTHLQGLHLILQLTYQSSIMQASIPHSQQSSKQRLEVSECPPCGDSWHQHVHLRCNNNVSEKIHLNPGWVNALEIALARSIILSDMPQRKAAIVNCWMFSEIIAATAHNQW